MKFTVVIPTADRSNTLRHTIKTCVDQDYADYEILVSDNCSQDETRDVVDNFRDPRIRYINTGKRLSMSSNWEFALNHVSEGYITYLGDDDGLLPQAVTDVAQIVAGSSTKAVSWLKADYCWPCNLNSNMQNICIIPLQNRLYLYNSKRIINDITNLWLAYYRAPCVYNSFVDVEAMHRVRRQSGRFFASVTPDVYSGLVLLSQFDNYIYSTRPFSVNAASGRSNGTAGRLSQEIAEQFFREIDIPMHPKWPLIRGVVVSCVTESLMQIKERGFFNDLRIDLKRHLKYLIREICTMEPALYEASIKQALNIAKMNSLEKQAQKYIAKYANKPINKATMLRVTEGRSMFLSIFADRLNCFDVYAASKIISSILGPYEQPAELSSYFHHSKIMARLYILFGRYVSDRTL